MTTATKRVVSNNQLEALLASWERKIGRKKPPVPTLPITVLTGEAIDLACLAREHWEAQGGDEARPGLGSGLVSGLMGPNVIDEILELALAVGLAHAKYRLTDSVPPAPVERAMFLLSEIRQGLLFLFDDGKLTNEDAEIKRLSASHNDTSTHSALALSVEGFALYANRHKKELLQLPGFEESYLTEAFEVAHRLREQAARARSGRAAHERERWLRARNGLVVFLSERIAAVRRAARYVFRAHPKIAKEYLSAYEQRKKARRRKGGE